MDAPNLNVNSNVTSIAATNVGFKTNELIIKVAACNAGVATAL